MSVCDLPREYNGRTLVLRSVFVVVVVVAGVGVGIFLHFCLAPSHILTYTFSRFISLFCSLSVFHSINLIYAQT